MDESPGFVARLRAYNEDGTLYFWGGVVSALISWLLIPLFGMAAVYSGYKLYDEDGKTTSAAVIVVAGAIGVLTWLAFLATTA